MLTLFVFKNKRIFRKIFNTFISFLILYRIIFYKCLKFKKNLYNVIYIYINLYILHYIDFLYIYIFI